MSALVLSILLVVLMFGAVLWVVDGEHTKPTSVPPPSRPPQPELVSLPVDPPAPPVPPRRRQPATSRRRPPPVAAPATLERRPLAAVTVSAAPVAPTVRPSGAPLPRHRLRSTVLLVLLVLLVGVLVAAVIGVIVTALAFALRSAVTS